MFDQIIDAVECYYLEHGKLPCLVMSHDAALALYEEIVPKFPEWDEALFGEEPVQHHIDRVSRLCADKVARLAIELGAPLHSVGIQICTPLGMLDWYVGGADEIPWSLREIPESQIGA